MKVSKESIQDLIDDLTELGEALEEVSEHADRIARTANTIGGEVGRVVGGQLEGYLIGTLESFYSIDETHQPGNIEGLKEFLENYLENEPE
jgi:hypothetical protein